MEVDSSVKVIASTFPSLGFLNFTITSAVVQEELKWTSEEIARWIHMIFRPIYLVIGTIGNGLTFYIMRRTSLKDVSSCFYMSLLALADTSKHILILSGLLNRFPIKHFYPRSTPSQFYCWLGALFGGGAFFLIWRSCREYYEISYTTPHTVQPYTLARAEQWKTVAFLDVNYHQVRCSEIFKGVTCIVLYPLHRGLI